MMKYRHPVAALVSLICLTGALQTASAEGTDTANASASEGLNLLGLRFTGFTSMEFGQMLNPWMLTNPTSREDILRTYVNFGVTKQVTPQLKIEASVEAKMYYNTFNQEQTSSILEGFFMPTTYYAFYMDRAFGSYSLGDVKAPFLQFTLGYFPYKYNPDVRDLGEYLYRSGTYPAYILNNFDLPQARLAGLKVSSDLFGMLHQDLLLTLTTDLPPYFDMNLGYIVSFHDPSKIIDIGFGGMYQSLAPLDENLTQPKRVDNSYMKNATQDSLGNIVGDTTTEYYTAAGLKLMARLSFDIKGFFGPTILGSEDLKLYGEAAILGVQDYPSDYPTNKVNPYGYDTLMHKIPITLGFNVPTFKALDVFTAEVEYYGCTYPSTIQVKDETVYKPVPVPPGNLTTIGDPHDYASIDDWKWAFYAKRSFKNGIFIVGQVACDHIRNESPVNAFYDTEEILRTNRSWWWALKLGYKF